MAPNDEPYFPPLERCLSGSFELITWKLASDTLCEPEYASDGPWLLDFLACESSVRLLVRAVHGFPKASASARSALETRTSAVNVTPTSHGPSNIEDIKQDALWLSKDVNLDENEALRIAIVEWQSRPICRLKEGFSEHETATVHRLAGAVGSSAPFPQVLGKRSDHEASKSFLAVERRRSRLLSLFFEERRSLVATCQKLFCLADMKDPHQPATNHVQKDKGTPSGAEKLTEVSRIILHSAVRPISKDGPENHVLTCMAAMQSRLDSLENERTKYQGERYGGRFEGDWVDAHLQELLMISDIVHLSWRANRRIAKSSTVLPWFQMMAKYDFFASFPAQSDRQAKLVTSLQVSVAATSVALLDPASAVSYLVESQIRLQLEQQNDDSFLYFFDRSSINELQQVFVYLAGACIRVASPAVFAWGIVLYTVRELGILAKEARDNQQVQKVIDQGAANEQQRSRRLSSSSIGSIQQSIYEDITDHAREVTPDDPVEYLMQSALGSCQVFDVVANMASSPPPSSTDSLIFWKRMAFLDLIKTSFDSIGYAPELLTATFAILDGDARRDSSDLISRSMVSKDVARAFMSDAFLMAKIFGSAMSRFPYEAQPFLRLCEMLAHVRSSSRSDISAIAEKLLVMESFTQSIPPNFAGYHTIREDENANLVSLEQPLDTCAFSESTMFLTNATERVDVDDSYLIPNGVTGQVVSDSKPAVIMWHHRYSGLGFLGRCLQFFQNGQRAYFMYQADSPEGIVAVIIQLLASLVRSSSDDGGRMILEEASDGLERNSDIILVVFEIFEQQISNLRFNRAAEESLSIGAACAEFMEALVAVFPERAWPSFARSSFLNMAGGSSLLAVIMSREATIGTSNFIMACVQLYARLLDNAIGQTFSPNLAGNPRELKRLSTMGSTGPPTRVVVQSLLAFTDTIAEMYDSISNWQLMPYVHRLLVRTSITQTFRRLLDYGFGIEGNNKSPAKMTTVASTSSVHVLDFFRPDSPNDANLQTPLQILVEGLEEQESLHGESFFQAQVSHIEQTLWLCYGLLRAARLKENSTFLERQLYHAFPVLVRLYGAHGKYKVPCLKLMTELIAVGSVSESDSSSLLSILGMESSRSLLEILVTFDRPRSNTVLLTTVWEMLTVLLTARQQWFAVYILTGLSPQEQLKDKQTEGPTSTIGLRGKPFLQTALDDLSHMESIDGRRAIAMLSFVCKAQENWSWATNSGQSHPDFFAGIMSHVSKLDLKEHSTLNQAYQCKIAALVAELSMVYLHQARSNRDSSIIKKMMPAFKWYTANAIGNTKYNNSLNSNLRKNLQARYPNCDLAAFKKTAFSSHRYGEDFFYDTSMASKLLSFDPSWDGTVRNPGFAHEFRLANLNLSLVDSQLSLLHSFKATCIEHATFFARDREVQKLMAQVAQNCLTANQQHCPTEKIFETLFENHIELAVGLLQRLVEVRARGSEFATLLALAWETTKFRTVNYNAAIVGNDLNYYRSCLSSLLLCIQLHVETRNSSSQQQQPSPGRASHTSTRTIILEILSTIVAEGVGQVSNALFDQTQSQNQSNEPSSGLGVGLRDFSLMLSILHSVLQLPTASQMISQISSVFISSNIIDSTIRLYSWSHRLNPPDVDPVFSSCALSVLVALSTLPPLAEELGIEGVLGRLATSRITLALQSVSGGVGPFETMRRSPKLPHQHRLYAVWSEGILPLCLNLLHSVGRPMASEIAAFLNQFSDQLARASTAFATSSTSHNNSTTISSQLQVQAGGGDSLISLSLCREAAQLALISHILLSYRLAGASAGVDSFDIRPLTHYDESARKKTLREDIEEVLALNGAGTAAQRRNRIMATSEREVGWGRSKSKNKGKKYNGDKGEKGGGGSSGEVDNVLEEKVVEELTCALVCLKEEGTDEDNLR